MKLALFLCGVFIFADASALSIPAFAATIVLLLALGFRHGHLRAVGGAWVVLASAVVADVLWQLNWEPFNRSGEYEAIAQSPFVLIGLPVPMAIVAVGVAARALLQRKRRRLT